MALEHGTRLRLRRQKTSLAYSVLACISKYKLTSNRHLILVLLTTREKIRGREINSQVFRSNSMQRLLHIRPPSLNVRWGQHGKLAKQKISSGTMGNTSPTSNPIPAMSGSPTNFKTPVYFPVFSPTVEEETSRKQN